jgi:glycosyltransferase involved in cell wall biosynthesis
MRILHVLDHGLPTQDGYVYRTHGLLAGQRAQGHETFHLTSPRHEFEVAGEEEEIEGWRFYRTVVKNPPRSTALRSLLEMRATARRLDQLCRELKPDLLHAHSPLLNGYPALRVGRRLGIPVLYEIRAFWEDAAVDQGSAREDDLRYRLTRAAETRLCRKVDAIATICEGLRRSLIARGIEPQKISVVPNAVEAARFCRDRRPVARSRGQARPRRRHRARLHRLLLRL